MLNVLKDEVDIVIGLEGDMTIFQADELYSSLKPLLSGAKDITLDVSAVNEIDSSAVQILLVAQSALTGLGKELTLINHSAAVLDLLRVMGLSGCFNDPVLEPAQRSEGRGAL